MAKTKTRYVCQNCEYISPRYLGRCPNCGSWNSLVEEIEKRESSTKAQPRVSISGTTVKPKLIDDVSTVETPRFKTNLEEFTTSFWAIIYSREKGSLCFWRRKCNSN